MLQLWERVTTYCPAFHDMQRGKKTTKKTENCPHPASGNCKGPVLSVVWWSQSHSWGSLSVQETGIGSGPLPSLFLPTMDLNLLVTPDRFDAQATGLGYTAKQSDSFCLLAWHNVNESQQVIWLNVYYHHLFKHLMDMLACSAFSLCLFTWKYQVLIINMLQLWKCAHIIK